MERAVEQRERGALAGAGERGAFAELLTALDVGGRQRSQRARHFRERELGEVSLLEIREPAIERCAVATLRHRG